MILITRRKLWLDFVSRGEPHEESEGDADIQRLLADGICDTGFDLIRGGKFALLNLYLRV
jgi:hypothetical protein